MSSGDQKRPIVATKLVLKCVFNPNPHCLEIKKKNLFCENENKPWRLKRNIFKKSKLPRKKS
jgi:hypothetical protein